MQTQKRWHPDASDAENETSSLPNMTAICYLWSSFEVINDAGVFLNGTLKNTQQGPLKSPYYPYIEKYVHMYREIV